MKISSTDTVARVLRRFVITEDHPVVGMAYASQPKKVRIERGLIEYQYRDGKWVVATQFSISLSGPVLKKDGTGSKNDHTRHPETASYSDAENFRADFAWLKPIVDLLRPTGRVALMRLTNTTVNVPSDG
jgi:hypothetical protein